MAVTPYADVERVGSFYLGTHANGDKCFFRLSDMQTSDWLSFMSVERRTDTTFRLMSHAGSKAVFDLEDGSLSNWQFY